MKSNTVIQWYKAIKAEAQCVTCHRWEQSAKPNEIELHHIDADTKADCVSNIVYRHQIVYKQPPAPVTFLLETLKCAPLCRIDHTALHDAERACNTALLTDRFDLVEDGEYQKLNGQFWQMVIGKTPIDIRNQVNETLLDMLDDGRIIMGPRGFQLAPARVQVPACR